MSSAVAVTVVSASEVVPCARVMAADRRKGLRGGFHAVPTQRAMDVHIDKPWREKLAAKIEHLLARRRRDRLIRDRGDLSVRDRGRGRAPGDPEK